MKSLPRGSLKDWIGNGLRKEEQLAELQRSMAEVKAENAEIRQDICNEKAKKQGYTLF